MPAHPRRLLAAAVVPGAVAAAVLAGPGAASASTGPRYASAEQAGYAATGAQFGYLTASVYLRKPAQYAGVVGQYSHTIQLWSSGLVAVFGASASTSGSSLHPVRPHLRRQQPPAARLGPQRIVVRRGQLRPCHRQLRGRRHTEIPG